MVVVGDKYGVADFDALPYALRHYPGSRSSPSTCSIWTVQTFGSGRWSSAGRSSIALSNQDASKSGTASFRGQRSRLLRCRGDGLEGIVSKLAPSWSNLVTA